MNIFSVLLLLFIMIPVIEIYLFIQVGGVIGAPSTIALVIVTAIVGAALLRQQGLSTLMRVRTEMDRGQIPAMAMMEGVVLLICGAFLLTPGFFTDAVGFLGLIPFTRRALLGVFMAKGVVRVVGGGPRGPHAPGRGFGTGPGAG
ncbi:MAG: FxsA family protein, partial [Gammaproteobacteria bacterium]